MAANCYEANVQFKGSVIPAPLSNSQMQTTSSICIEICLKKQIDVMGKPTCNGN